MISYYSFLSTLTQHLKKTLYHNVSPTSFIEGIRTGETSLGSVEECEGVTTSDGKHWGSITLCEFIVCQLLMNHNVIIIIKLNNGIKNMCWPMYNIFEGLAETEPIKLDPDQTNRPHPLLLPWGTMYLQGMKGDTVTFGCVLFLLFLAETGFC